MNGIWNPEYGINKIHIYNTEDPNSEQCRPRRRIIFHQNRSYKVALYLKQ
jgi:hypothetical protein